MILLKKTGRAFLYFCLSLTLSLLIVSSVGVVAAGIWAGALDTGIDEEIFFAAAKDKTTRLYYYDAAGDAIELASDRVSGYENALWCPIDEMPTHLKNAFVAIEDKRFYHHKGIDWARTLSATKRYVTGKEADFGGSTITQQLVKNLTGDSEKSVRRKVGELIRAAKLERSLSKAEILEQYLNVVNLSENCYGVRTAANAFFSKEPQELTLRESATIAAITNNPARYDPIRHPEANRGRRDIILREMRAQGMINEEEYRDAIAEETTLHVREQSLSGRVNSWYADLVVGDVIEGLIAEKGLTRAAASRMVYCGGLKIYTAVQPDLQALLEEYYGDFDHFPTHEGGKKAESAMMIVDPRNGDILAIVGAVGEKDSNRIQNFATDAKRPSGSVIKPLSVYAPALQNGVITWSTVFDDIPKNFRKNGAPWPKNSPDLYRGLTTVKAALTESVNTVSVSVLERLGSSVSYRFLKNELELTSLDPNVDTGAAALALGQQNEGLTLRELVGGYTALANGGVFEGTRSFYQVLDAKGEPLLSRQPREKRVMDEDNAAILTMLLRNVVQNGTGKALELKYTVDVAGKTGTSSKNCDKWFIGYTPELLAGVWYGYEYPSSLADVKGNPALTTFDRVMSEAIKIRPPKETQFKTSDDLLTVRYCKDSGKLPCEACLIDPRGDRLEVGYFKKGTEPTEHCDRHIAVRYCVGGGIACEDCPEEETHMTALLRVSRVFPRQIKVLDAPYTYGGAATKNGRILSCNEPYYAIRYNSKQNFGVAMGLDPYNRLCPVHGGDDFLARRAEPPPEQEEIA